MEKGSLSLKWPDRTVPLDLIFLKTNEWAPDQSNAPFAPKIFGNAGIEHMKKLVFIIIIFFFKYNN